MIRKPRRLLAGLFNPRADGPPVTTGSARAYISDMADTAPAPGLPAHDELLALEQSASAAARLMKLLSSEQRLILLCRLLEGECSVGDLAQYVRLAPAATSQHLAKLRAEGLVTTRRDGQSIYYALTDPKAVRVIDTLCELYRDRPSPRP